MEIWWQYGWLIAIFIEKMKYKKKSLLYYQTFSQEQGKWRQEEGSNQAGGRKQAGGRQGVVVAGQSMPGQQELVWAGDGPQEQTKADECAVEVRDGMGVVGREGGHSGPAVHHNCPIWNSCPKTLRKAKKRQKIITLQNSTDQYCSTAVDWKLSFTPF